MKIGIVNNSLGNVGSVYSALQFYHYDVHLVSKAAELKTVDVIILAGVGNFPTAVRKLKRYRLWEPLNEHVLGRRKPVLGICLGMQLFADVSLEGGRTEGFGWIHGEVKKIEGDALRLPHMGWNEARGNGHPLFADMKTDFFYFMHSYHFVPVEQSVVVGMTCYEGVDIVSAVHQGNVVGVQFHPEKSQGNGLRLLRNYLKVAAS